MYKPKLMCQQTAEKEVITQISCPTGCRDCSFFFFSSIPLYSSSLHTWMWIGKLGSTPVRHQGSQSVLTCGSVACVHSADSTTQRTDFRTRTTSRSLSPHRYFSHVCSSCYDDVSLTSTTSTRTHYYRSALCVFVGLAAHVRCRESWS